MFRNLPIKLDVFLGQIRNMFPHFNVFRLDFFEILSYFVPFNDKENVALLFVFYLQICAMDFGVFCEKLSVYACQLSRISFPFAGLISNCVNQSLRQAEASHFESTEKSLFEKFDRR